MDDSEKNNFTTIHLHTVRKKILICNFTCEYQCDNYVTYIVGDSAHRDIIMNYGFYCNPCDDK